MFKAIAVIGPHQSGKTTLEKDLFINKPNVNFENPDIRFLATEDPSNSWKSLLQEMNIPAE